MLVDSVAKYLFNASRIWYCLFLPVNLVKRSSSFRSSAVMLADITALIFSFILHLFFATLPNFFESTKKPLNIVFNYFLTLKTKQNERVR